jgi:CubicO group peptidase (beta-lactamase class C family)
MIKRKVSLVNTLFAFVLFLSPHIALNAIGQNAPALDRDAVATTTLADYFQKAAGLGFSGAVMVAAGDKVLLRNGYGWADEKRRIPIVPETVFDIGSITKVFTAIAVMQLEERGKLSTSDPIARYFSKVPTDKTAITIHHLLTHTAGLAHDDFYASATPEVREILKDREQFIQRILSFPLASEPGTKRAYSNSGFSFLAAIVEQLSGQSYESYLRENVLRPSAMSNTGYVLRQWNNKLIARGYNDGPTDFGYPWQGQWAGKIIAWDLLGNGGLLSTVDDMQRFVVALRDGKLLNEKTKAKMLTVYFAERDQAYGWFISKTERDSHRFIHHGGDAVPEGWNADLRWFPDDNLIAVVLTNKRNRAGSVRRYAMNDLVDITLFGKRPEIPPFANIDASRLRPHTGTYQLDSGATLHVTVSDSAVGSGKTSAILTISGKGQQAIDLLFSANQLPGLTKLSVDLNNKMNAYIEALRRNDLSALKKIPGGDLSPEEAMRSWTEFVKRNGELKDLEILGTSPLNQAGVQTFARLDFARTSGVYHVTWRDQKLHMQDEDTLQPKITNFLRKSFVDYPLSLPFLPQSSVDFATYDLFKGRTIKITFTGDRLVVHTKDGDISARKL